MTEYYIIRGLDGTQYFKKYDRYEDALAAAVAAREDDFQVVHVCEKVCSTVLGTKTSKKIKSRKNK